MHAAFDHPGANAIAVLAIVWAAGVLVTIAVVLLYTAVQSYGPDLSCEKLRDNAGGGDVPRNIDAWNDYELICGQPPLS
jgi:hypothetical protein